jgi:ABC-type nickel/cobalt efflux system permease component RcnA
VLSHAIGAALRLILLAVVALVAREVALRYNDRRFADGPHPPTAPLKT